MRIKRNEYIIEVDRVWIRSGDIFINGNYYKTGSDTEKIEQQLLTEGYADLTGYGVSSC